MVAPHVAGVILSCLAEEGRLLPAAIKDWLLETASFNRIDIWAPNTSINCFMDHVILQRQA